MRRDYIDRLATPNSLSSLIGKAPTSNTIFNAKDGISPLQVKHRNCNLCLLIRLFFFFPKPYRSRYVLYKSLLLGLVIQKSCRSPLVSCKFGFFVEPCIANLCFLAFCRSDIFLGCKSVFFFYFFYS